MITEAPHNCSAESHGDESCLHLISDCWFYCHLSRASNRTYTFFGQQSGDRITNLRVLLGLNLQHIERAIDRDDFDNIVLWLGDYILNAYRMYREVPNPREYYRTLIKALLQI